MPGAGRAAKVDNGVAHRRPRRCSPARRCACPHMPPNTCTPQPSQSIPLQTPVSAAVLGFIVMQLAWLWAFLLVLGVLQLIGRKALYELKALAWETGV